jgi:hypothetical protein
MRQQLLVVVSDGMFTDEERVDGQQRPGRLRRTGCALLWLAPNPLHPLWPG